MGTEPTRRTRIAWRFWSIVNPLVRPLAGFMPFWLLLETTGRTTGQLRRTPLVNGPLDPGVLHLIAVHGTRTGWVRNLLAEPRVRVRRRGRWLTGTAEVVDLDPAIVGRFSAYGRLGLRSFGEDARLVRIRLDDARARP